MRIIYYHDKHSLLPYDFMICFLYLKSKKLISAKVKTKNTKKLISNRREETN